MRGLAPFWIDPQDTSLDFPDVRQALHEPDGLLAVGGDLSPERLRAAYRRGIFPWFNHDQPILWWSPNPRTVLFPEQLKISRSLRKTLRQGLFTVTMDSAFSEVIEACSGPRTNEGADPGTWITLEMKQAYLQLHEAGFAHSVECWQDGKLVGGLYGVAIGQVFFGESMFTRQTDASKVAFVYLVKQLTQWGFKLIDCQIHSAHLESLGAESISRESFTHLLDRHCEAPNQPTPWQLDELDELDELDKLLNTSPTTPQQNPSTQNPSAKKQADLLQNLAFFVSAPQDCGYLPERSSITLFADPAATMQTTHYSALVEAGFRRSGAYVYKPHCGECQACIPARIAVDDYLPNRTQKRTQRINTLHDTKITTLIMPPAMREEQFILYRKYMSSRHTGGGMDDPSANKYMDFLTSTWAQTEFVEFRQGDHLMAVAVMDILDRGLSSVYTFFDPDYPKLSLGRYALMWQIEEAKRRHLPHLYLGYWIKDCQKMVYKQEYRPVELFIDGQWKHFKAKQELPS